MREIVVQGARRLRCRSRRLVQQPAQLLDSVASALTRAGMHDRAGDFYERLDELQRALDSYIRGSAYRKAVYWPCLARAIVAAIQPCSSIRTER